MSGPAAVAAVACSASANSEHCVAVVDACIAAPAAAQEITLRAVSGFQEGTYFARNFERFVKKVNEEGKGVVQINYLGGPKAIPTMEQGAALRNNVVDLANTTTSFESHSSERFYDVKSTVLPE